MVLELPPLIVLQSFALSQEYLGFVDNKNDKYDRYLEFSEIGVLSPYAKFEVEPATGAGNDGLVHIRSSKNHKYLERKQNLSITGKPDEQYWITVTADKKEEDQSKETCTLFKFIPVDAAKSTFRIMHVQSGCYLCLWKLQRHPVLANYKIFDWQSCDIFRVIDWESLTLPKYVALKGHNGKYLCLQNQPYLQFAANDMEDPTVICEVFDKEDGNICIKSVSTGKYWRPLNSNWILADSDASEKKFRPVKVDHDRKKIALINVDNDNFCKPYTSEGKESCLSAVISFIDEEGELTVEEPVKKREISDVKYKLEYAIFVEEKDLILATKTVSNDTHQATTKDVKLSYIDLKISSWDPYLSVKSGVKASFVDIKLPFKSKYCLELSDELFKQEVKWEETQIISNKSVEVVHKVDVPPMTKVTVDLYASYAKFEVPCSFIQKDTLYNGSTVPIEVERASYTGSNYYNIRCVPSKVEKL